MASIVDRARRAWNVFRGREDTRYKIDYGPGYYTKPDRRRLSMSNERSIVTAVYERIAIDTSMVDILHAKIDDDKNFVREMSSNLQNCLSISANVDQTGVAFIQDVALSMFDEGCVAVVPTYTNEDNKYDIYELRTGEIREWYPKAVKVKLYNDKNGQHEEVVVKKEDCAIIENPFYAVMNERNSIAKRLIRKLNLLDAIDEQSGQGKLDLIIQLPYVIKSEARRVQAEARRKDIEDQLNNSKYGIAYADGTERIIQLNRSLENNLMSQIEYLTTMLYGQLGISEEILNGTASEQQMINYYNNTIVPVLTAITHEFRRKFLTPTAISQKQSIIFIRSPFKFVPANNIADIADKFTRNEVLSSNEVRSLIGYRPVDDSRADELRNKNLNASNDQLPVQVHPDDVEDIQGHEAGDQTE